MDRKVAVIDLGTNTFHLMIAEWDEQEYRVIYRERLPVKIGMGGINNDVITPQGVNRALDALKIFRNIIGREGATKVLAFGTSALRNARNGKEVIEQIQHQTGIEVKLITGDEEAAYIYSGVRKALNLGESVSLIADIGGGSVEFIIGNKNSILWKRSFEIGAQRLLERFQQHDPILPNEVSKIFSYLDIELKPLLEAVLLYKPETLVGSSGTFDTLSDIHCIRYGLPHLADAPETPLTIESFLETYTELLVKNREARMKIPGMIEMRVDMIVVACCLIAYLQDHANFKSVRVSSYSLKEGVLASLPPHPGLWPPLYPRERGRG